MQIKKRLKTNIEYNYVALMMDVIGRGLVMASQIDADIQHEIAGFPTNFVFSMRVFPKGPQFFIHIDEKHQLKLLRRAPKKIDLMITFKHLHHAFLVFSFQESTARAFANDRMIADGEISYAIRLVRCLNRMEALILPKMVAKLAVKDYPEQLDLKSKIKTATHIYFKIAQSYLRRSA